MHLLSLASCYNQTKLFVVNAHLFYVLILAPVALCELSLSSSMPFCLSSIPCLGNMVRFKFPAALGFDALPNFFEIAESIKKDGG